MSSLEERGAALASIPHRPPFLFIDEVLELTRDRIVARKWVDPAADYFAGHYPGNPIMPGVMVCECAFQAGAILMTHRGLPNSSFGIQNSKKAVPVLTRIREAKFKQVVRPGDTLRVEVVFDEELEGACYMTGRVNVEAATALRVEFVCMIFAEGEPHQ